ncbi:MAG TPA: hypothetical protein DCY13_00255, partial [Verrucomicrobiales bacterium]|nr:hypothetical protein [Verrucomicrobiales bacterium]
MTWNQVAVCCLPQTTGARHLQLAASRGTGNVLLQTKTPVRYLAPGHGKTKQGYFWTAHRPGGEVLYHWEPSRAAACLDHVLPVD